MSEKAVPHQVQAQHYSELVSKPTTEVLLEPARGPMGQSKLCLDKRLWSKILSLLPAAYRPAEDQTVIPVSLASRLVTALAEARPRADAWPEKDKAMLERVFRLLYQHDGLVISKR